MKQSANEALNDLILINNDLIKEYQLGLEYTHHQNQDLQQLFRKILDQIRKFNDDLQAAVRANGKDPEQGISVSGRLHRAWLELKFSFHSDIRKDLLVACEKCEDAVKELYREVMQGDNELSPNERELLYVQMKEQSVYHKAIKNLRDQEKDQS